MVIARRIGAVLLIAAAVAIWFLMEPAIPDTPRASAQERVGDRESEIERALSDAELNENIADSAPQQQVVNGWVARDLLEIIAMQQNDDVTRTEVAPPVTPVVPPDERVPALIGLLVFGVALALATAPRAPASVPSPITGSPGTVGAQQPWTAPAAS